MLIVGTETSGSIISPSQANGLVGLRPTVGLVPGYGIAPISASQDTAGPMDRTVANAAMTLQSIAGYDAHNADYYRGIWGPGITDTDIIPPVPQTVPNYMSALDLELRARQADRLERHAAPRSTRAKAALAGRRRDPRRAPGDQPPGRCPAASSTTRPTATSTHYYRAPRPGRADQERWPRRSPTTRPTSTRR